MDRRYRPQSRSRRWLTAWHPWLLAGLLSLLWPIMDGGLIEPPPMLASEPEQVRGRFSRCGPGRLINCVIDGDTFKIGERNVRIIGIDAPEIRSAQCPEELKQGEAAATHLVYLLSQGPFTMRGRLDDATDGYGRELRALSRELPDGSTQSIAADMLESGTVRRYLGGLRGGWC